MESSNTRQNSVFAKFKTKIKQMLNFELLRYVSAILLSILIAILIICLVSNEPGVAIQKFLLGPLSKARYFSNVLELMIPLMFAGLGVALILRVKIFNMAGEGMFYTGGVVAAAVACMVQLPAGIHPVVALVLGGLAGALVSLIPTILKLKFNASEIVSSLMINYVVFKVGDFIIKDYLRDPKVVSRVSSYLYKDTALLPKLFGNVHVGMIIIIVLLILSYLFLYRTKWGYAVRMVGENRKFAKYSGIKVTTTILLMQLVGGFIVGLGGATQILGATTRLNYGWSSGYGWDGLIVAIVARYNPKLIPVAAFILAYMRIGSDVMSRTTDVQNEVVAIIQGIMIILIVSAAFLSSLKNKLVIRSATTGLKQSKEVR